MKECFDSLGSALNCKPEKLPEEAKKIANLVRGLCKVLDCDPNELESKVETFQKEREKEISNLKKENAQFAGELNTRKEDNDKTVAELREQIRVLKEAMEEEETLI